MQKLCSPCHRLTGWHHHSLKYSEMRCRSLPVTLRSLQVLISMIDDISSGQPIKAMQPKAPKTANGGGMNPNNAFPSPGGMGGMVPGPFGAGAGGNPNVMYNGNAGYMTQQQQPGFGMPQQQYGMPGHPGMYQPQQMGMGYQQQPQQMMQQQQQSNGMAFL